MITREVREWIQKVERGQYNYNDALYELSHFAGYVNPKIFINPL